jgi:Protein of unknown function (DUF2795)
LHFHRLEVNVASGKLNPIKLQKHLKGVGYPARKDELVRRAEENGGGEDLLSTLRRLPDQEYSTPAAVNAAVSALS